MSNFALCPLSTQTQFDANGRVMVGAKVYIFDAGTTTPKTTYKDSIGQAAHPRPVLTGADGRIPPIYVGTGDYRVRITNPANVIITDMDGLPGASTDNGGGPGPDPTPGASDLISGDVIWSYMTGPRSGFTPCNGGTIGQATSGASNVAVGLPSAQPQPAGSAYTLFKELWERDNLLPVYSSSVKVTRGATALADWDANRTIGVPDLRGRTIMGLDTMGATAANVIQVATTITTTSGEAKATVAAADGLCVGMGVVATGIPDETTIAKIDGLTVTLSRLPTFTVSGAQARFSMFGDAQKLGRMGGAAGHKLSEDEIPAHIHGATSVCGKAGKHSHTGVTDIQGRHVHTYVDTLIAPNVAPLDGGGPYGSSNASRTTDPAGDHAHNVATDTALDHEHTITTTIAKTGGGTNHNNLIPAVLGTFYIKL